MEASGAPLAEELGDLIETMRETIPDETALYKTAIKFLLKKGHSLTEVRQDFDKCIGALEAKDREFETQLRAQFDKRVGSKNQTVSGCQHQIEFKQADIKRIQEEIATLEAQAREAQSSIAAEQDKLTLAQSRFTLVYKALRSQIETQSAKIAQHGEQV